MRTQQDALFFQGRKPRVMAHRGSSGTHPENTLPAFAQGVADGADILELDVHLTADGKIVVMHDETVDRTTDGSGSVHGFTYDQLRRLDAGYKFTPDGGKTFPFRGKGIYLPLFEEVLVTFRGMPINVEIKDHDRRLVSKVMNLLARTNRLAEGSVLVAAEKPELMKMIRSVEPCAVTGFNRREVYCFLSSAYTRLPFLFRKTKAPALQLPDRTRGVTITTPAVVRAAHRLGFEVHVWTVNEEAEMRRLLAMGVDGLFTDFPARMRRLVDSNSGGF